MMKGHEAWLVEVNKFMILRWIGGVTNKDTIRNEHIRGTTRLLQVSKKITKNHLKWYGHMMREEERIFKRVLDVEILGKRTRRRPNLQRKNA